MTDTVDSLVLDLLEWLGPTPRPYDEVLDAWRTSCPRLPVWEDANDRGFIDQRSEPGRGRLVSVSPAGAEYLHHRRWPRDPPRRPRVPPDAARVTRVAGLGRRDAWVPPPAPAPGTRRPT